MGLLGHKVISISISKEAAKFSSIDWATSSLAFHPPVRPISSERTGCATTARRWNEIVWRRTDVNTQSVHRWGPASTRQSLHLPYRGFARKHLFVSHANGGEKKTKLVPSRPVKLADRCRYILAQEWPDLHDSRFKNKDNFTANSD